jgi:Uma2 family endonuclease
MAVLVHDPEIEARLKAEREASDAGKHDEVWDGVYVMSPLPNNEHQFLVAELWLVFRTVLKALGGGLAYNGLNVSDREEGWLQNYREPDVAVILPGNRAKDCGTHWCGGPDFLVEILSPNDPARDKRPFYAEIGVREMLVLDRDPWMLELYRLDAGRLDLVGTSTPDRPDALTSAVLPLTFRLVPGQERPRIEVSPTDGDASWLI